MKRRRNRVVNPFESNPYNEGFRNCGLSVEEKYKLFRLK